MSAEDLPSFFTAVHCALAEGSYLAGYLTYESGGLLQGLPAHALAPGCPLARLGVYRQPEIFDHLAEQDSHSVGNENDGAHPRPLRLAMLPTVAPAAYEGSIQRILELIAQGDTYQVNFTIPFQSHFAGDGLEAYTALLFEQPCSYGAMLRLDTDCTVLSFSPELFFATTSDGSITTRPMKGTAPRTGAGMPDDEAVTALQADEKNRAEHVMIVDLLRNDLGRVCQPGSIRVDDLFHVESYPTVHQMVSTVSGELRKGVLWNDIFAAIFPSGSITGAPKRRTMQIIHEIEAAPRGIYTGAIGYIAPSGEAAFSVPIRTLTLHESAQVVTMGVGGGIVADSVAAEEWKECLLKTSFVHRACEELCLIETMLVEGSARSVPRLDLHMERLGVSALALGFQVDEELVRGAIAGACATVAAGLWRRRLRLTLSRFGKVQSTIAALEPWPAALRVKIAADRTNPADPALRYKTTFRQAYDDAFRLAKQQGWDECLFLNTRDELTEGCVTNLVLAKHGILQTPASACGVLPGIFRRKMIEAGLLHEAVLYSSDLADADAVYLCNSVRGLVPVQSVQPLHGGAIHFDPEKAESLRLSSLIKLDRHGT